MSADLSLQKRKIDDEFDKLFAVASTAPPPIALPNLFAARLMPPPAPPTPKQPKLPPQPPPQQPKEPAPAPITPPAPASTAAAPKRLIVKTYSKKPQTVKSEPKITQTDPTKSTAPAMPPSPPPPPPAQVDQTEDSIEIATDHMEYAPEDEPLMMDTSFLSLPRTVGSHIYLQAQPLRKSKANLSLEQEWVVASVFCKTGYIYNSQHVIDHPFFNEDLLEWDFEDYYSKNEDRILHLTHLYDFWLKYNRSPSAIDIKSDPLFKQTIIRTRKPGAPPSRARGGDDSEDEYEDEDLDFDGESSDGDTDFKPQQPIGGATTERHRRRPKRKRDPIDPNMTPIEVLSSENEYMDDDNSHNVDHDDAHERDEDASPESQIELISKRRKQSADADEFLWTIQIVPVLPFMFIRPHRRRESNLSSQSRRAGQRNRIDFTKLSSIHHQRDIPHRDLYQPDSIEVVLDTLPSIRDMSRWDTITDKSIFHNLSKSKLALFTANNRMYYGGEYWTSIQEYIASESGRGKLSHWCIDDRKLEDVAFVHMYRTRHSSHVFLKRNVRSVLDGEWKLNRLTKEDLEFLSLQYGWFNHKFDPIDPYLDYIVPHTLVAPEPITPHLHPRRNRKLRAPTKRFGAVNGIDADSESNTPRRGRPRKYPKRDGTNNVQKGQKSERHRGRPKKYYREDETWTPPVDIANMPHREHDAKVDDYEQRISQLEEEIVSYGVVSQGPPQLKLRPPRKVEEDSKRPIAPDNRGDPFLDDAFANVPLYAVDSSDPFPGHGGASELFK